jgi:hypothetical protein
MGVPYRASDGLFREDTMENLINYATKLGIDSPTNRAPILEASVKAMCHETVLFFLCGRDYIYNPNDLKITGIEKLFIGPGTPYQINISQASLLEFQGILRSPAFNVKNTIGGPQQFNTFANKPLPTKGGVGNYNLHTKALSKAVEGLGPNFLRDMLKQVQSAKAGGPTMVSPAAVSKNVQDMRNAARRFWMSGLFEIGL